MSYSKNKAVSAMLVASMITALFCSCSFIPSQDPGTVPTGSSAEPAETAKETTETTMKPTETVQTTEETTTAEVTYETAAESSVPDRYYVRTVDGVEPEMMNADYWIDADDSIILMNQKEIAAFNYENRGVIKAGDGETIFPHLDEFEDKFDGNTLRTFLNDNAKAVPEYPPKFFLEGERTDYLYWQNLVDLSNIDGVEDEVEVQFAYTVKRMTLRLFPTEDRVFDSRDDQYFDTILISSIW